MNFMKDTAKIVRFHKAGGPEVLQIEELPIPEPGRNEVRLRVRAIGLNRAEVMFRNNQYLYTPSLPSKLGYEASGIVEAVGANVDPALMGRTMSTVPAFPADAYGVYGEVAIVPAAALAAYPATLSFEEGASIWMQYITAYGALVHHSHIQKDDFVLITAASSSVGIAAIEIAKADGAISIATTRTAKKRSDLLSAGADHVIVTDEEDIAVRVAEITAGKGVRVVFDPIGGPGVLSLAQSAAQFGTVFVYGALSPEPTPYPLFVCLMKSLRIQGYTLFELTTDKKLFEQATRYVYEHLESGALSPRIDKMFSLSNIVEAHRYMEENEQIGKIVICV
jgi:NADPH:quinone reductase-like Zn-dependent oxidoreductase